MYPRPFEFVQAQSVGDAVELLASPGEPRLIAGGQSLVPSLSLGICRPDRVIDINALPLDGIEAQRGTIVVGALTRHRELELGKRAREWLPLAAEAAAFIGNPFVRNRGTLGGSLSYADPAGELCTTALAYGGSAILAGPNGERSVPFDEFFREPFLTAAHSNELLIRVEFQRPPAGSGSAFVEVTARGNDSALAAAASIITLEDDCLRIRNIRLVIGGRQARPVLVTEAQRCVGRIFDESVRALLLEVAREAADADEDVFYSATYRAQMQAVCAARAATAAYERARSAQ